ncbi:MAG: patatin-like phospholipase family protein [Thermoproteota archaeon]|nr:patatin-like phospholipase family protein [Thermoproteota archaeon]MDQ4066823.1 patatin-like phospholipase family protein [Thermoproteota archaeon]
MQNGNNNNNNNGLQDNSSSSQININQDSVETRSNWHPCHNNKRHNHSRKVENVIVLQGGGSLGAFACGAFKAMVREGIKIDIASGTSVGAINAAIIAGSKSDQPERDLEEFWLELAESSYSIVPDFFFFDYNQDAGMVSFKRMPSAGINSALFGVPNMFVPRWLGGGVVESSYKDIIGQNGSALMPSRWTYLYDHSPLGKILEKYLDFSKLDSNQSVKKKSSTSVYNARLIITCVNVLNAEPIVFDSAKMRIQTKHLLATTAYPVYGFPWVEVEDGTYAWDGSLLDNTPVRQVLKASPRNDKRIYIIENYPRNIDSLPSDLMEVADRTRDIIFSDKTKSSLRLAKFITRQINLIEELYDVFEASEHSKFNPQKIRFIKEEYDAIVNNHGAEILEVSRIARERISSPHLLKNADFSPKQIRELIEQGERKTQDYLKKKKKLANRGKKRDNLAVKSS